MRGDETKHPDDKLWLFTIAEVAERTTHSDRHIRRLIRDGEMRTVNIGRRVLVEQTELERFIASHRQETK